jgi:hypothetical protein
VVPFKPVVLLTPVKQFSSLKVKQFSSFDSLEAKKFRSKMFFFGVPHSATFIFIIFVYVIASIAYIHPVNGVGVQTHNLLIMSPLPYPLDHGSRQEV